MSNRIAAIALIGIAISIPTRSNALDFDKLLKKLNQQQGANTSGTQQASVPSNSGKQSSGTSLTENYCRQSFSMAGVGKKNKVNQSVVLDEFNLAAPGDFFDAYLQASSEPSFAFPNRRFYQGEFETDRINVLYDLVLSYPSSLYLAALITESRKDHNSPQYDHQAKVDALAALTIIHYYMKGVSKEPDRWKQLANKLQGEEHYTARVITARLLASGEMGTKDPDRALTYASEANNLRQKYSSEQGYRTMSSRNYAVTSNRTIYDVVVANPRSQQARYFTQFAQQYGAALKNPVLAPELEAKLGPGLRSIEKSSESAARKASEMLTGAQQLSLLKAEKNSLDSATRNRVTDSPADVNIDDKTMLSITRQMEKLTTLDDRQKKQFAAALADAHESGDKAIGMMPVMMSSIMSLMMQRGMEYMPAIIPYARKLQYHSDNACSVFSRWDQAAQVTKSTEDTSRNSLAALVSESN